MPDKRCSLFILDDIPKVGTGVSDSLKATPLDRQPILLSAGGHVARASSAE